jgi:hypothetical protein
MVLGVQKIQNMRSPTKSGVPKAGVTYSESIGPIARMVKALFLCAHSRNRFCRFRLCARSVGGVSTTLLDDTIYSGTASTTVTLNIVRVNTCRNCRWCRLMPDVKVNVLLFWGH